MVGGSSRVAVLSAVVASLVRVAKLTREQRPSESTPGLAKNLPSFRRSPKLKSQP